MSAQDQALSEGMVSALFVDPEAVITEAQVRAVAARHVRDVLAAEQRGARQALLEVELEIRMATTIPSTVRAAISAVLRGRARAALPHPSTDPSP